MTKPHKHAEAIKAWADGKQIQWASPTCPTAKDPLGQREPEWFDATAPEWLESRLYRVKPAPRWQKEREAYDRGERIQWRSTPPQHAGMAWRDVPPGSPMSLAFDEPTNEFRIPHKWQDVIDAHARGEVCQYRDSDPMVAWAYRCHDWRDFDTKDTPQPNWCTTATREYRIKPKVKTIRHCLIRNSDGSVRTGNAKTEAAEKAIEARSDFLMWCGPRKEVPADAKKMAFAFGFDPASLDGDWSGFAVRFSDGTSERFEDFCARSGI